jgi:NAD(P)-dependent dehydrogenase (short-subunit alcohol dehydrogenase family)
MSELLDNRVAIVTGGARGVGFSIAQTLSMHGAHVLIVDNGCALDGSPEDPTACEAAAERCKGEAIARSVLEPGVAQEAVDLAVQRYGAVDIVVNAASVVRNHALGEGSPDDFDAVLANGLTATQRMLHAAVPVMKRQREAGRVPGAVLNLVSSAGIYGRRNALAQSTCSAAVMGLTRAAALDLRGSRITCNALVPFVGSRSDLAFEPATDSERRYKTQASRINPSFAANLAAWLVSTEAASVTGQLFAVRAREIFLFTQPRPVERVFGGAGILDADEMSDLVLNKLAAYFTPLETDRDVFNTEPIL